MYKYLLQNVLAMKKHSVNHDNSNASYIISSTSNQSLIYLFMIGCLFLENFYPFMVKKPLILDYSSQLWLKFEVT